MKEQGQIFQIEIEQVKAIKIIIIKNQEVNFDFSEHWCHLF